MKVIGLDFLEGETEILVRCKYEDGVKAALNRCAAMEWLDWDQPYERDGEIVKILVENRWDLLHVIDELTRESDYPSDEECMEKMLEIKKKHEPPSSPKFRDWMIRRMDL